MTLEQRRQMLSEAYNALVDATFQGGSARAVVKVQDALRAEIVALNQELIRIAQAQQGGAGQVKSANPEQTAA